MKWTGKELKFDSKVEVGYIEGTRPITEEDVESILVTAFEGGITYWASLNTYSGAMRNRPSGIPSSQWSAKVILEGKPIYIVEDNESDPGIELDLPRLINGIKLVATDSNSNGTEVGSAAGFNSSLDDVDSDLADMIIQYSIFGELVYS